MARAATVTKPKPALKAAGKLGVRIPGKAIVKPAPGKALAKPGKAAPEFRVGQVVIFHDYAEKGEPGTQNFTEGEELGIVTIRVEQTEGGDVQMLGCVKLTDYHAYVANEAAVKAKKLAVNDIEGEELTPTEVRRKRGNDDVPEEEKPFKLTVVGDMAKLLKSGDLVEVAQSLNNRATESFFYLGGVLAQLYQAKNEEKQRLYTEEEDEEGKPYEGTREGFEKFLADKFGDDFGGWRKAQTLIQTYVRFSELPNAASVLESLLKVGSWKASQIASYVTEDNAEELIETAMAQSSEALQQTLKTEYTSEGGRSPSGRTVNRASVKKTTYTYKLFEDQAAAINMIWAAARKQTGITDDNQLFEHILTEWAGDHLAEVAAKATARKEATGRSFLKAGSKLPHLKKNEDEAEAA